MKMYSGGIVAVKKFNMLNHICGFGRILFPRVRTMIVYVIERKDTDNEGCVTGRFLGQDGPEVFKTDTTFEHAIKFYDEASAVRCLSILTEYMVLQDVFFVVTEHEFI